MIFADSSFWIALKNESDPDHESAVRVMREIKSNRYGRLCTSDYVLDEVATFISQRLKRHDVAFETLQSILASREVDLLKVDLAVFRAAVDIFRDHDFLSFTDATTCALMKLHKINNIATFDEDFARLGFNVIR
jgi:predicted nucleic acid-binding protein